MSQSQRNRDEDCDVIFRIGKRSFMACREVLIQKVKFFESMFTLDMKEKNEFVIDLDPEVINPNVFDAILNFIYSSKLNLSVNNVKALYCAADFLCFTELSNKIVEYMNSNMILDNIPTFMIIAKTYNLPALVDKCKKCIIANPNHLLGQGLTDYLTYDELTTLLKARTLQPDDKFRYAMKWILEGEGDDRQGKLMDLLRMVEIDKLSSKVLKENIVKNEQIFGNLEALQFVFSATITNLETSDKMKNEKEYSLRYETSQHERTNEDHWNEVQKLKNKITNYKKILQTEKIKYYDYDA